MHRRGPAQADGGGEPRDLRPDGGRERGAVGEDSKPEPGNWKKSVSHKIFFKKKYLIHFEIEGVLDRLETENEARQREARELQEQMERDQARKYKFLGK